MGHLSTHVLDTANGKPAQGVRLRLDRIEGAKAIHVVETTTNADGRTNAPLLSGASYRPGTYVLTFEVRAYFEGLNGSGSCAFLDEVPIRFVIAEDDGRYHVPLLVSPWSFSTYRGS